MNTIPTTISTLDEERIETLLSARLQEMERNMEEKMAALQKKHAEEIARLTDQIHSNHRPMNTLHAEGECRCGLMYVPAWLNGHQVTAMIDSGATNSFVDTKIMKLLGAEALPQQTKKFRTVTNEVIPDQGETLLNLIVGDWQENRVFFVTELTGFHLLLGLDFLVAAEVLVIPKLWGIHIGRDTCSGFIKAHSTCDKDEMLPPGNGWIIE